MRTDLLENGRFLVENAVEVPAATNGLGGGLHSMTLAIDDLDPNRSVLSFGVSCGDLFRPEFMVRYMTNR